MDCSEFNRLIDSYIDGESDEAARARLEEHAAKCSECSKNLAAAKQLRDILSHLNDDITVPLPAQAAWRKAVKEEVRRKRMKQLYSICAAAAAFVLMFGVTVMLRPDSSANISPVMPRVETDGVNEAVGIEQEAAMISAVRSVDYVVRSIESADTVQAYEYLCDVIAEYDGIIERESDGDWKKVYVQIPGENAADFISAVDSIGEPVDTGTVAFDASASSIGICVTILGA